MLAKLSNRANSVITRLTIEHSPDRFTCDAHVQKLQKIANFFMCEKICSFKEYLTRSFINFFFQKAYLSRLGGTDAMEAVEVIMKIIATDKCWRFVSWTGRRQNKYRLENAKISSLIFKKTPLMILKQKKDRNLYVEVLHFN